MSTVSLDNSSSLETKINALECASLHRLWDFLESGGYLRRSAEGSADELDLDTLTPVREREIFQFVDGELQASEVPVCHFQ